MRLATDHQIKPSKDDQRSLDHSNFSRSRVRDFAARLHDVANCRNFLTLFFLILSLTHSFLSFLIQFTFIRKYAFFFLSISNFIHLFMSSRFSVNIGQSIFYSNCCFFLQFIFSIFLIPLSSKECFDFFSFLSILIILHHIHV